MNKILPIILILSFSSNVFSDKTSYKNLVDKTNNTNERIAVCIPVYVEMGAFYEYVLIKQLKESNSKWKKTANMLRNSLSREFFALDLIEGNSSLKNLKDSALDESSGVRLIKEKNTGSKCFKSINKIIKKKEYTRLFDKADNDAIQIINNIIKENKK